MLKVPLNPYQSINQAINRSHLMTGNTFLNLCMCHAASLIVQTTELVNTAMLNEHIISWPMHVYLLTHHGRSSDITMQSTCHSQDERALKVYKICCCYVQVSVSKSTCFKVGLDGNVGLSHIFVFIIIFVLCIHSYVFFIQHHTETAVFKRQLKVQLMFAFRFLTLALRV